MWAAIAAGVVFHEFFCEEGELLSDEVDRQRAKRPLVVHTLILITAAHLLRLLRPEVDPYTRIGQIIKKGTKI